MTKWHLSLLLFGTFGLRTQPACHEEAHAICRWHVRLFCLTVWAKVLVDSSHQLANVYVQAPPEDIQLLCYLQPSSLSIWYPRHCGAEAIHRFWALSKFLTHRVCEHNEIVVLCDSVEEWLVMQQQIGKDHPPGPVSESCKGSVYTSSNPDWQLCQATVTKLTTLQMLSLCPFHGASSSCSLSSKSQFLLPVYRALSTSVSITRLQGSVCLHISKPDKMQTGVYMKESERLLVKEMKTQVSWCWKTWLLAIACMRTDYRLKKKNVNHDD